MLFGRPGKGLFQSLTSPWQEEYYIPMEKEKSIDYSRTDDPEGPGKEQVAGELQERAGKDDPCRCKEASTMTPRELLRLMIGDLTFWKKANKE
jgi:hypothetical protein